MTCELTRPLGGERTWQFRLHTACARMGGALHQLWQLLFVEHLPFVDDVIAE
jgi:hypothetical protein